MIVNQGKTILSKTIKALQKKEQPPAAISRRGFLGNLWKLSAFGAVGCTLAGCASGGLPLVQVRDEDDRLKIPLSEAPALALAGGAIALSSAAEGELNIIVLHVADNEYLALSPICTHLGCRVRKGRDGFECPCHGSRYDLYGHVVNGPAARPLARFPIRREGEALVIELN
jgi:nitrite reductase/ring-hydroxylating ferredoxin subunit